MFKVTKATKKTKSYSAESGKPDYKYTILLISKEIMFGGVMVNTLDGYFFSVDDHHELESFTDEVDISEFNIEESEDDEGRVFKWLVNK